MYRATWLRRAGWIGVFSLSIATVQSANADEPKAKIAGQEEIEDLGPASELVPKVRRRSVVRGVLNDVETSDFQFGPHKYTLKVSLTRVPESLNAQLRLNNEGALVSSVTEGGPADKAGLKVYDVLVTIADQPIKKITDVIKVVNDSEGKPLTFKVLRGSEPVELTVTAEAPEIKTDGDRLHLYRRAVDEATSRADKAAKEATRRVEIELHELENKLHEKLKDAGVDVRMQVIQPGRIVPHGIFVTEEEIAFPDDLKVSIRKNGNEPAQIEVTRGDESWEVTEDKVDALPDDVRTHVKRMLGRSGARYSIAMPKLSEESRERAKAMAAEAHQRAEVVRAEARERAKEASQAARHRVEELRERLGDRLEHRLDQLSNEMKQLRERVEELRRSLQEEEEVERAKQDEEEVEERTTDAKRDGGETEEDEDEANDDEVRNEV